MGIKIIVAGSRDFNDYELLKTSLIKILKGKKPSEVTIVSGCARGADTFGERFAKETKCNVQKFPANWDLHGKSAGYKRNYEMADYATHCVVFWDGKSKGTKHMIDLAKQKNLELHIVKYGQEIK